MIEFIQNLGRIKNQQSQWRNQPFANRIQIVDQVFQILAQELESSFSSSDFHARKDLALASQWWERQQKFLRSLQEPALIPNGLQAHFFDSRGSYSYSLGQVLKSLIAGNAVILFGLDLLPHQKASWSNLTQKLSQQNLPAPLSIFVGDEMFLQVIAGHPSIQALSFHGSPATADKILAIPQIIYKKLQITRGVHNTALILSDAHLAQAAAALAPMILLQDPTWPLSLAEIFVLESQVDQFVQELNQSLVQLRQTESLPGSTKNPKADEIRKRLRSEPGTYLSAFEEAGLFVVQDFSHCSDLHQESFVDPILFIQPVKYAHEMVKWVRAMDHGLMAVICGSDERIHKCASQLPVSTIVANGILDRLQDFPLGRGRNFIGIPDQNFDGFFFTNPQKIDGLV